MLPDLFAVRQNLSALQLQKPQKNVHHRRLSGPGGTHDPHALSNGDLHIRMVKNKNLRIGIFIYNILQFNLVPDLQLLHLVRLPVGLLVIIDAFIPDLLLQIVRDSHEKGLKIGDGRQMVVDPVCTGDQPHGGDRQDTQLRHDIGNLPALQHADHHIQDHSRNRHRLDQKPRRRIVEIVALNRTHVSGSAFGIFVDKIALLVCDLDLLDPHHRLVDPFVQPAVVLLVLLPGPAHNGF